MRKGILIVETDEDEIQTEMVDYEALPHEFMDLVQDALEDTCNFSRIPISIIDELYDLNEVGGRNIHLIEAGEEIEYMGQVELEVVESD